MIRKLLRSGKPFAIYNLPGECVSENIVQADKFPAQVILPDHSLSSGFYFMPFSDSKTIHGYRIRPDFVFTGDQVPEDLNLFENETSDYGWNDVQIPVFTKDEYLKKILQIKKAIQNGTVEKVVLSRPVRIPLPVDFDPEGFYKAIQKSFPDLFSFFVHIPGVVSWAGATPELLAGKENQSLILSALAGTQSGLNRGDRVSWPDKEQYEHALVGQHILEMVRESGFPVPEQTKTETIWSGSLAHLRTIYRIPFPRGKGVFEKLICRLHPTPAVGGYPKQVALAMIRLVEGYDRGYYSGFLGPWNIGKTSELFVNLRSVQITGTSLIIYAGGGITAGSDPEMEWEETEQKAQAMLSVLEKMTNFNG
ncbi:MAG: hypothetical protein GXO83_05900 [Chlorobi bacterium]|nr:hypothetical protein [Chlorobiota bacterium]